MSFSSLMKDTVSLLKKNGEKTDGIKASVQKRKIFIDRSDVLIETGDLIQRKMSNGGEETYEVIDPGFYERHGSIAAHYQMDVKKLGLSEAKGITRHVDSLAKDSKNLESVDIPETQNMIKLFISHSSKDQELVEKLTELVKNALRLSSSEIRCTTIDGYRLSGGANTNEQIKREVRDTKAFIGLISFAATDSMYVLFELGARWGSDKHLLPLLAPGVSHDILKGPLSELNALSCGNSSQLHQLVNDLAEILEIESEPPQAYQRYIDGILAIPPSEDEISLVDDQVEAIPACKLTDVQIQIMKAVADMERREATVANIAKVIGLPEMEANYNLDELARKHKFLDWIGNMNRDVPNCYVITHEGRGFVLSLRDSG